MSRTPNHHRPLSCTEPGINLVHQKTCPGKTTAVCNCDPSFQGQAWSRLHQRNLRRTFRTLEEARLWREETIEALADPAALAPGQAFFDLAASNWLAAAKAGTVRTRSGTPFKPAALRSYEDSIRRFLAPRLGRTRLADITRTDIQDVIDWMVAEGYAPSTVRNAVLPLRSILRRALDREEIETNPTERLDLPIDRRKKDRVAPPEEVDALLDALPEQPPADLGTRRLHRPSARRAPGPRLEERRSGAGDDRSRALLGPGRRLHRPEEPGRLQACSSAGHP